MTKKVEKLIEKILSGENIPLEVSIFTTMGLGERDISNYRKKIDSIQNNFHKQKRNIEKKYRDPNTQKAYEQSNFPETKVYSRRNNDIKKTINSYRKEKIKGGCFSFTTLNNILADRENLNMGIIVPKKDNHILSYLKTRDKLYAIENTLEEDGFEFNYNDICYIGSNNLLILEYIRLTPDLFSTHNKTNKILKFASSLDPNYPQIHKEIKGTNYNSLRLITGIKNQIKYNKLKSEQYKTFQEFQIENNPRYLNYRDKIDNRSNYSKIMNL